MQRTGFFIFTFFLFSLNAPIHAQDISEIEGDWGGAIDLSGEGLPINLTFSWSQGELDGTLSIPRQQAFNLPVEVLSSSADTLVFQFQTGAGPAVFYGKRGGSTGTISGDFEQAGMSFPFSISKVTAAGRHTSEKEILIPAGEGEISGSLLPGDPSRPLVFLVSGSGSQNRNAEAAGFPVFGTLADSLCRHGYSSFRYDDRGTGGSSGDPDATLQELASDLAVVINYLREEHHQLFDGIVLLGHSQGGLVASMAAGRYGTKAAGSGIAGIIFMSSPFVPGDEVINQQIEIISEAQGIPDETLEKNLRFQQRIYEAVRSGEGWEAIETDLAVRLEDQIYQLPEPQREALGDMSVFIQSQINRQLSAAKTRWFKSFIELESREPVSSLDMPLLAVFGEKDTQVLSGPNAEAAEAIGRSNGLNLNIVTIPGANHLFQSADSGLPGEYGLLDKEFADGFIETVVVWLKSVESPE